MRLFPEPLRFEWDAGNSGKNEALHGVSNQEAEEVFFDPTGFLFEDAGHSGVERRAGLLGETQGGRRLTVIFTLRHDSVRVISARDMSRKERRTHEAAQKDPDL